MRPTFSFQGQIQASKSVMNRALVIQSYLPSLILQGDSESEDVLLMRQGLRDLMAGRPVFCGQAGTVLRFLALRASRLKGKFFLRGTERLMGRLPQALIQTLSQLGADVELKGHELQITCDDWRLRGDGLWIPSSESSQFASAVLLNSWGLKSPLHFVRSGPRVSDSYFGMTLEMVRAFGMSIHENGNEYSVSAGQTPVGESYQVECDVSSAFVVAAMAAVGGRAQIQNFPHHSMQPDVQFVSLLLRMGVPLQQEGSCLGVEKAQELKGIEADLVNSPDLLPVLAVLSLFAKTPSRFWGLQHLRFKESDRLKNTLSLISALGGQGEYDDEKGLQVTPVTEIHQRPIVFDPDQDHRMAMAAALAKVAGFQIQVTHPEVVNKSFPGFWELVPS